jgi:hypothetical protein
MTPADDGIQGELDSEAPTREQSLMKKGVEF